jgi:hypothetical protein
MIIILLRIRVMPPPDNLETELQKLGDRMDTHLEQYRVDCKDFTERQIKIQLAHEQNMEAIKALTEATSAVVNAWTVAAGLQKFIKWISSFAVVGAAIMWILSKLPAGFFK